MLPIVLSRGCMLVASLRARIYIKVWKSRMARSIKELSPLPTVGEGAERENEGAGAPMRQALPSGTPNGVAVRPP